MIVTLSGMVTEKQTELVIIDVKGVGYGVLMTIEEYASLQKDATAKVYIYEHLRENAHDLYGFLGLETKRFFEQLLEVNGVGPRMALSLLNIGSVESLKQAIASGDVKYIQQANGVGKRLAERIIVELKDKVGLPSTDLESSGILQGGAAALHDEAALALVSLGYSPYDATQALRGVDPKLSTEERIRTALKGAK